MDMNNDYCRMRQSVGKFAMALGDLCSVVRIDLLQEG
jgi:hypothetical protein